jgi:glutamate 5-kinase
LSYKVVPIINENDVISTQELEESPITKSFGDNDHLSALVAGKLCAQKLVLLTNVDGLYTDNPNTNAQAQRIDTVDNFEALGHVGLKGQSGDGRGGMASKVQAARIAAICGVETYITSGLKSRPLGFLADPTTPFSGTRVLPFAGLASRKQWIGFASGALGRIVVNAGAAKALLQKHASLLPVGIVGTQGQFLSGEVVSIVTESAEELGRGVTSYSAEEVRRIQGLKSQAIAQALGTRAQVDLLQTGAEPPHEVIHRDALVIFQELAATST